MTCAFHARRRPRMAAESLARAGKPGRTSFTSGNREPGALLSALAGLILSTLAIAGPAGAVNPEAVIMRLRAEQIVSAGQCKEALPLLRNAQLKDASDSRTAFLEGQCLIQLNRFDEAVVPLTRAKKIDPTLAEADLMLAVAYYHLEEYERAQKALDASEPALVDNAQFQLYTGMLLLGRGESRAAALAFERAKQLDPEAVEPAASYYGGLAWKAADERQRAAQTMARVQESVPGTVWAEQARRSMEPAPSAEQERGYWISATAGFQWDDNVVLRGTNVDSDDGDSDAAGVWSIAGGFDLFRTTNWSSGVLASYSGSAYGDLSSFNENYPSISLWLDRKITDSTFARLQPDFGFVWLDGDSYVATGGSTATIFHDLGSEGTVSLFGRYAYFDFLDPIPKLPAGPNPGFESRDRDRDGHEYSVGLDYSRALGETTSLSSGYQYRFYDASGREYSHQAHDFLVGVSQALPWEVTMDVSTGFTYRPYDRSSTFPDPPGSLTYHDSNRSEYTWTAEVSLARPLNDWLTAVVSYLHEDNISNVDVYDYDRNVVGVYFAAQLPD